MNLSSSQSFLSLFQLCVTILGAMAAAWARCTTCAGCAWSARRSAPSTVAMSCSCSRSWCSCPGSTCCCRSGLLTTVLALTFAAALSIGFRPVLAPRPRCGWASALLIGAQPLDGPNVIEALHVWQLALRVGREQRRRAARRDRVANLYVQGGMQLRHVAWFAGGLGGLRLGLHPRVAGVEPADPGVRQSPALPGDGHADRFRRGHRRPRRPAGLRRVHDRRGQGLRPAGARLALALVLVFGAAMPTLSGCSSTTSTPAWTSSSRRRPGSGRRRSSGTCGCAAATAVSAP